MKIDSNFFIHDLDKSALSALHSIPGFTQVLKSFMKIWDEQLFRITNMSTNLRLSEKQLPEYYHMLTPICDKLGIEVPELYLELNGLPNSYTSGDTKPFIVLTSGLVQTLPHELIPTVIAHECGHIACHHVLYSTMGRFLLGGIGEVANFIPFGLGDVALWPIKVAFYYWMRCSEYSADRAAMICDASAEKVIAMCMHFAGMDKDITANANIEAFMEQAVQYKELVDENAVNKTMEFLLLSNETHPFNAVRAYESNEWEKSDAFLNISSYIDSAGGAECDWLPLSNISEKYLGQEYLWVKEELDGSGFTNIELVRRTGADSRKDKPSAVVEIAINGITDFADADWYSRDSVIEVAYYLPETQAEIAAAHPGQAQMPDSSKGYNGKDCAAVIAELENLGFANIETFEQKNAKKGIFSKENSIERITINGQSQFNQGDWVDRDAVIRITYNTFSK